MTDQNRPLPTQAPTIDPGELAAAVTRLEAWREHGRTVQPNHDHLGDVRYRSYPISDADLDLLLADYRFHRPTQWAYDQACAALHKRPTHSEYERAEAERDEQRARADTAEARIRELEAERAEATTEWTLGYRDTDGIYDYAPTTYTEAGARHHATKHPHAFPAYRLIGPWRDADPQPDTTPHQQQA
jgi:hypothetical protein